MEEKEYLYDAFISYRHLPIDNWAAEKVHKTLETYRLPKEIAKKCNRSKIARVFRDKEELVSSGDLANELLEALKKSRYLILICSSKTIESEWVMKEVRTFKELGRQSRILILLVEGSPATALPQILRTHEKEVTLPDGTKVTIEEEVEPLAADIRGADQREREKKFKTEILRIIAPVVGCSYDDLKQRHKERKHKKWMLGSVALAVLIIAFGIYNAWRVSEIETQMNAKLAIQSRALADQSIRLLEKGDRMRSLLVALEALPKDFTHPERPLMDEVQHALSNALYTYDFGLNMKADKTLEYTNVIKRTFLSPEGSKAVTISEDGTLQIWDMKTSEMLISRHRDFGSWNKENVAFINEEEILIGEEDKLQLFNIAAGTSKWEKAISKEQFCLIDQQTVGCIDGDDLIILDVSNGNETNRISLSARGYYYKWIMVKDQSNKDCLFVGNGGQLWMLDLKQNKVIVSQKEEKYIVNSAACTETGEFIVALNPYTDDVVEELMESGNAKVVSIKLVNGKIELNWEHEFKQGYLSLLRVVPSLNVKVVVVQKQKMHILDPHTGESLKEYIQPAPIVDYVCFDNMAYAASSNGQVSILPYEDMLISPGLEIKHEGEISSFDFTNGVGVMSVQGDKKVYIYRWLTGQEKVALNEEASFLYNLGCSKDDQYLFMRDRDENIEIETADAKTKVSKFKISENALLYGFLHNSEYFYSIAFDDGFNIFETATGKVIYTMGDHEELGSVEGLVEDPESGLIYCLCDYGIVGLSSKDFTEQLMIPYKEKLSDKKMALTMNGNILVSSQDGSLLLFDVKAQTVSVLVNEVQNFVLDQRNDRFAIKKEDGSVQVMDLSEKKVIWNLEAEKASEICYMQFEPETQNLWIGYEDTNIEIVDLKSGEIQEIADDFSYALEKIDFFKEQDKVILYTQSAQKEDLGIVYKRSEMTKLAEVHGIRDVSSDCSNFYILGYAGKGYIVPFYSTEQLAAEAVKQLQGRMLTDKEKRQFFITE